VNRLPVEQRVRILASLCEGASIRSTCRITGAAKGTVLRLLAEVGDACARYHDETIRDLTCVRVQCDEIWSFCGVKDRNMRPKHRGKKNVGSAWTWTAIDADTKLIICYLLGKRTFQFARRFSNELAYRIKSFVQISTDGLNMYNEAITYAFGYRADYGQEVKVYGRPESDDPDTRYSPQVVLETKRRTIMGAPDHNHISTACVERQNLTMRMSMRRFTRLTNAFSKKMENMQRALALHFMYYNFCRVHSTLKTTPAIKHGITDRIWTVHDLARLPDFMRGDAAA